MVLEDLPAQFNNQTTNIACDIVCRGDKGRPVSDELPRAEHTRTSVDRVQPVSAAGLMSALSGTFNLGRLLLGLVMGFLSYAL
eukprot:1185094-Prorocentrum_minimum.AAC.4